MIVLRRLSLLAFIIFAAAPAQAADIAVRQPVERASGLPDRVAILIAGASPAQPARGARAAQDAETIGRRLSEFAFTTVTVNAANRPDLDRQLRDAAASVPPGADVVVMAFGRLLSTSDEVWIVPGDAPADVETRPETLPTEALRLSDALRRLGRSGPRAMSVVVDECANLKSGDCAVNSVARLAGASTDLGIIATTRIMAPPTDGRPLAARASAGDAILKAMTVEGENFLDFYVRLQKELVGGNLAVTPTVALSNTFEFWPSGLFDKMQIPCNNVEPEASVEKIKLTDVGVLSESCRRAASVWPYVPRFAANLSTTTEQAAVKASLGSCADAASARDYLASYSSGRWRTPVRAFLDDCEAQDRALKAGQRKEEVERVTARIEKLVQSNASASELSGAGLKALDLDAGMAAFRAYNEIDWRTDEEAAWRIGQFYDPTVNDKTLRAAVPRPDPARAASYYNQFRTVPRHREALDKLCREQSDAQSRDERFRDFCR